MYSWFLYVAISMVAGIVMVGGAGVLVKLVRVAKRLLTPSDHETVHNVLESPGARLVPPNVQVQMIYNWIAATKSTHVDPSKRRLAKALVRLRELDKARQAAEMALWFESVLLCRAKKYLVERGVGVTSVAVQTTAPSAVAALSTNQKRVRFRMTINTRETSSGLRNAFIQLIDVIREVCGYWKCAVVVLKAIGSHLKEPVMLRIALRTIGRWFGKVINISAEVDANNTKVIVKLFSFQVLTMNRPQT